jgi:hypothetical protein
MLLLAMLHAIKRGAACLPLLALCALLIALMW